MDGSVSTLAPVFAAPSPHIKAGTLFSWVWPPPSGRASAWASPRRCRTTACSAGGSSALARGGLRSDDDGGRHRPHLAVSHFQLLFRDVHRRGHRRDGTGVIAWVRHRYMDTPLLSAAFQVVVGARWYLSWDTDRVGVMRTLFPPTPKIAPRCYRPILKGPFASPKRHFNRTVGSKGCTGKVVLFSGKNPSWHLRVAATSGRGSVGQKPSPEDRRYKRRRCARYFEMP